MSKGSNTSAKKRAERAARDRRLSLALRDNLRRRKEQLRARDARATASEISSTSDSGGLSAGPDSTKSNRHGGTTAD